MSNVENLPSQPLIGEVEVRMYMAKPICRKCQEKKGIQKFLTEGAGQVVVGPQQLPMTVWSCDLCETTVHLPPGAFPKLMPRMIKLEDVEGPRGGEKKG